MPKYQVDYNGKTYTVEAANPQAAATAAAKGASASQGAPQASQANAKKNTQAGDVLGSFALSGVPKGITGLFGGAGDAAVLARGAGEWLASKAGMDVQARKAANREMFKDVPVIGGFLAEATGGDWNPFVTSGQLNKAVEENVGAYYKPQTTAGRYAEKVGEFLPNALGPGGVARKAAQVVAPAVASEGLRDAAKAAGVGERGQAAAEVIGALAGGSAVPGLSRPKLAGSVAEQRPLKQLAQAAPQDVTAMRARQAEYQAAGIQPTFVDVVDEAGQGYLSGAALRVPARPAARAYGDMKRAGLGDEVKAQARRHMSDDPRTPMEIAEELNKARSNKADQMFSAVRGESFAMPPETAQALRTDYGRAAIAEAAKRERDPDTRAALMRLSGDALDAPNAPITVGMADRVSRVLYGQAEAAKRAGDNDLAATFGGLADSVRNPAKTAYAGYGDALGEFARGSKLLEAAKRGEDFLKRDTDAFVADLKGASDEERAFARATGRRAVERAVGESPGAVPGVAERLFLAPEQRARSAELLGPDAQRLEDGVRLAHESYRRAQAMSPATGSPTAARSVASDVVGGAIDNGAAAVQALQGNLVPAARRLLKAKGLNDQQAAQLVQMATDPAQLENVLTILESKAGRESAEQFLKLVQESARLAAPVLPALASSGGL